MRYYKFLTEEGRGTYSGYQWPLPTKNTDGTWTPGEWVPPLDGEPRECQYGYHLCKAGQLVPWLNATLYEVEVSGCALVEEYTDKCATTSACRLVRKVDAWNERTARLFACDCAERVLYLFESVRPGDKRVRECIETARHYANGEATQEELTAASAAAWAADSDAASAAACAADSDAAKAAFWAADSDAASAAEREWQNRRLCEMLGIGA